MRTNVDNLPAYLDSASTLRERVTELEAELSALRDDRVGDSELIYQLSAGGMVLPVNGAARQAHEGAELQLADLVASPFVASLQDYVERHRQPAHVGHPYEQLMETDAKIPVWLRASFHEDGHGTLMLRPVPDAAATYALLALPPNAIDRATAPMFVLDLDGHLIHANALFTELTQHAPEALFGQGLSQFLTTGETQIEAPPPGEFGSWEHVVQIKRELVASEDCRIPVNVVLERLPDGCTIGLVRPIPVDRGALNDALAGAAMVFFTTDGHGRITTCQGRFLADLGLTTEACVGRPASVLPIPGIEADISEALGGGTLSTRRLGNGIPIECRAAPIRDAAGSVRGASFVAIDVAESHDRQERQRHAEVTGALARVAGAAAHRLNNEIFVMEYHAELAKRELRSDDPVASDLVQVLDAIGGAGRVARELLAISERQVLDRRPCDLGTILTDLTADLRAQLPPSARWTLTMDPAAWVEVDAAVIGRVVVALAAHCSETSVTGTRLPIEMAVRELDANQARWLELSAPGRYAMVTIGAVGDPGMGAMDFVVDPASGSLFPPEGALTVAAANGALRQNRGVLRMGPGGTSRLYLPIMESGRPASD